MATYTYNNTQISAIKTALAAGGNTVILAPGTYTLDRGSLNYVFLLNSNTTLLGTLDPNTGARLTTLLMSSTRNYPDVSGSGMILANGTSTSNRRSNIKIANLILTGNTTTGDYGSYENRLIVVNYGNNVEITNCQFINHDSDFVVFRNTISSSVHHNDMQLPGHECVYLLGGNSNIGIYNNNCRTRENGAFRISYSNHDVWIHHNIINGSSLDATHYTGLYTGNNATGPAIEIDKGVTYNVEIYENTFTNVRGAGIWGFANSGGLTCNNILIHHNTFTNCGQGTWNYGNASIVLYQYVAQIYNNRFVRTNNNRALSIAKYSDATTQSGNFTVSFTNNVGATANDILYYDSTSNHTISPSSGNTVGTGGGAGSGGGTTPPPVNTDPTITFVPSKNPITAGDSITLDWTATNCTSATWTSGTTVKPLTLGNGIGYNSGSIPVTPTITQSYRMDGYNGTKNTVKSFQVIVNPVTSVAPTCSSFYASSPSVTTTAGVMLYVKGARNTTSATIYVTTHSSAITLDSNGDGSSQIGVALGTNVFNLRLTGPTGLTADYYVTVVGTPAPIIYPPTLTLSPSNIIITHGDSFNITWTTTNTTSLVLTPGSIPLTPVASGTYTLQPDADIVYTVTATGTPLTSGLPNTVSSTVTVDVNELAQLIDPTLTLYTDDSIIDIDQSATIYWTATNTDELLYSGSETPLNPVSGSIVVSPTTTTTYTFTATGETSIERTITINVESDDIITLFKCSPSTVQLGHPTTLAWMTRYGKYWSIAPDVVVSGSIAAGTVEVFPTVDTTYTLTVSGSMGVATNTCDVTVIDAPVSGSLQGYAMVDKPLLPIGESAALSWVTEGASAVALNEYGFVEPAAAGSISRSPDVNTEYVFVATDGYADTIDMPVQVYVVYNYEILEPAPPDYTQQYVDMNARRIYVSGGQSTSDTIYSWDIDTNASIRPNPDNEMITFAYDETGFYTITLTSIDKDGNVLKQTVRANVVNI